MRSKVKTIDDILMKYKVFCNESAKYNSYISPENLTLIRIYTYNEYIKYADYYFNVMWSESRVGELHDCLKERKVKHIEELDKDFFENFITKSSYLLDYGEKGAMQPFYYYDFIDQIEHRSDAERNDFIEDYIISYIRQDKIKKIKK